MHYKLGCRLSYSVKDRTSFVFNLEAQEFPGQTIEHESLAIAPELAPERWTMPESGNRYFRVVAPPGKLMVEYQAQIRLEPAFDDPAQVREITPSRLPLPVFTHLYPSRYCQADRLERFARATFGHLEEGYARVNAICNWIYEYVDYEGGVSDALTSAFDTVTQRAGVCRDFAHLAIALCRTLGVPARYVSGYASRLQPPDFHAEIEAFLEGPAGRAWYLLDPTRKADPAGIVQIGVGRDAAEVAFCTPCGPAAYEKPEVWIEALGDPGAATTQAVRSGRVD